MKKIKKLPIGVQDFAKIRQEDYLYIDKTEYIYKLITSTDYAFLSRPRRFGKSLLVSTLKYLFQGEKELFKGLYIYDKYDFPKYPVIHISFSGDMRSVEQLIKRVSQILRNNQDALEVNCIDEDNYSNCFEKLIRDTYEKYNQKVVILIDEYDKPIIDNIDQIEVAMENRNILRGLYSIIKDMDPYIKFAFLTGVTKFSKAGIFSGLNNLEDITLEPEFGNMLGIMQGELEEHFGELFRDNNVDLEEVREWYNGYNFLGDLVYNPFDLLLFVKKGFRFRSYWFSSGTPKFLVDIIDKGNFYIPEIAGLRVDETLLESFDIDNMRPEAILFQAGYLTLDRMIERPRGGYEFLLRMPNKEVRMALMDVLLDYIEGIRDDREELQDRLTEVINRGDIEALGKEIESLLTGIPYYNYIHNDMSRYEGYYASLLYAYLQSTGNVIIGEEVTSRGRADLTMITKDKIYIFEIKVDTKESPIKQIKERQYYKKYENQNKPIYLVGIKIGSKERNVVGFEWERMN